jgi:hypothetical protein
VRQLMIKSKVTKPTNQTTFDANLCIGRGRRRRMTDRLFSALFVRCAQRFVHGRSPPRPRPIAPSSRHPQPTPAPRFSSYATAHPTKHP